MNWFGTLFGLFAAVAIHNASTSSDISAVGPSGQLWGTIAGASQPNQPIALIIPGSGPTDRDGNSPLGVSAATYRLLAEGLADRGIATVRIDKRGMFGSASAAADPNNVTLEDYVRDTSAWMDAIRKRTGARCIWLLGHSEGGLVALEAGSRLPDHICGLILISTAGRPLGEVLKSQIRENPANANILAQAESAIDTLMSGHHVAAASLDPSLAPLFKPEVQGFLISILSVDPIELIRTIEKPILIVQGDRDLQVKRSDAERLKRAASSAILATLPNTNHVLKRVDSDDVGANFATYSNPNLPLSAGVIDTISQFIKGEK